jgi:hypothetical protein
MIKYFFYFELDIILGNDTALLIEGPSGCGKTYCCSGDKKTEGIVQRFVRDFYKKHQMAVVKLKVSNLKI